jgi:histidine phosphotransferase ChpT
MLAGHMHMRPDLAALVGSRICHDLISPLGAIGNGVELMSLTDGNTDQEMALITESIENASARIRFFRIAYGSAAVDQASKQTEVVSVLAATASGGRCEYDWLVDDDQPLCDVRIAFLALQCIEVALPFGGRISIMKTDTSWHVQGIGKRQKVDEKLWESLSNAQSEFDHSAAQVQFALLPEAVSIAGRKLDVTISDDQITLAF